ncbi:MAG: hemerythrin family protein [bacterium]|nr:hemerythrin family protein [bacterium]
MALFDWQDSYSVNINQMDAQHLRLVEMINELYRVLLSNNPDEFLGDILHRLVEYAGVHFRDEEELMTKYDYPEFDSHSKEHQAFVEKIIGYHKEFKAGTLTLSVEIVNFLKDWLKNHIVAVDQKYSSFLNEKGIS